MIPLHMLIVDRGRMLRSVVPLVIITALVARPIAAQRALTPADSALIRRILLAEDRRDSSSVAFDEGKRHRDGRVQYIARRAEARVRDAKFAMRDSIPGAPKLAAPRVYAEPAWRLRFRALTAKSDCAAMRTAFADSAWAVRLRAIDLAPQTCAKDSTVLAAVRAWATMTRPTQRRPGNASWHPAAHAIVALARMSPADARAALPIVMTSPSPWLRKYAARAAGVLSDTASLEHLAGDADHNVVEAAIEGLASVAGHAGDDQFLAALGSSGYQAVRAAARALKGSPRSGDVSIAALAAARRLRADSSETSRDARVAVMELLAEFATPAQVPDLIPLATDFDCEIANLAAAVVRKQHANATPKCTPLPVTLPADAASLALGRDARIRVTLADSSGGGSFVVRLRGDVAPIMAARILALARSGYYNGLVWQRVEADFVVQGGGLEANEYMGNPRFMRDELGTVSHVRGTVGMSTRGHDTGDGQWFFNLRDNRRLDRDYTLFAEVVEGIDVVDGILEGDVIARMDVLPAAR
jgi:cyclophilin family peptidyl-prolyl cis-trans isomerase